jgi:hypothetical protein
VNPLAFVGLHSSVDARSHFPQHTWALAFHRGTMNPAKAPFCESVTTMLSPSAIRLSIQMGLVFEAFGQPLWHGGEKLRPERGSPGSAETFSPLSQRGNRKSASPGVVPATEADGAASPAGQSDRVFSGSEPLTRRSYSPYRESSLDGARGLFIQPPCTITPTSRLCPGKIENQQCSAPVYTCIKSYYFRSGFRKGYAILYEKNEPFHHF